MPDGSSSEAPVTKPGPSARAYVRQPMRDVERGERAGRDDGGRFVRFVATALLSISVRRRHIMAQSR